MNGELEAKRVGLLDELLPKATRFVQLVDVLNPVTLNDLVKTAQEAAASFGGDTQVVAAPTSDEIEAAFASLAQKRTDAILVSPSASFVNRRVKLAMLAAR
jgi:putative ABC transport system substrate-binding protein